MKIDKVIHSCNSNPLYSDFWPIVSKIWYQYFNIEPVLLYINDNNTIAKPETKYGTVIEVQPLANIPVSLQSLWIRYWHPITEPDTVFMISDIDMLPLSKYYFVDSLLNYNDYTYLHINPCIESYGLIPSCYHIGKGALFQEVLDLSTSFEDSVGEVYGFDNTHSTTGWFNDEKYATYKILSKLQSNSSPIRLIPRLGGQGGRRIDRSNWSYDPNLLKQDYYFDAHSVRPYSQYQLQIDALCNILLGQG